MEIAKVQIAVQTGRQDERGEEVYDPVYDLSSETIEEIIEVDENRFFAWPVPGQYLRYQGKRYEVLVVDWLLDEPELLLFVKRVPNVGFRRPE
jgi:hypothetical protein